MQVDATTHQASFQQAVRVVAHDFAIFASAWFAFICVDDQVFWSTEVDGAWDFDTTTFRRLAGTGGVGMHLVGGKGQMGNGVGPPSSGLVRRPSAHRHATPSNDWMRRHRLGCAFRAGKGSSNTQ